MNAVVGTRRSFFSLSVVCLTLLLLAFAGPATAQYAKPPCSSGANTTTISGVVYSPNGQDPIPDVLVYIPNGAAVTITDGASTADLRPVNPLSETTTAYDGSFTLTDVPAGTGVPFVIQSGKWQRVLTITTVTACQDNPLVDPTGDKFARFPKNKSEGNIPRIGVITGSAESTECILRKVGMDDAEFTNYADGGRINLILGNHNSGATINSSTPGESAVMSDASQVNAFDMLMFPCQGGEQSVTAQMNTNLLNFANNGGRVFLNHYSHIYLTSNSGFDNTFNWGSVTAASGTGLAATIDQSFTTGATLAFWLQNLGATTTQGKTTVSSVAKGLTSVTSNAQTWLTLDSDSHPIQATFDTPVGAGTGNTYGRVLYNEYHVTSSSGNTGKVFPAECNTTAMSAQEKMLEFSLFDLSSFSAISKVNPDMTLKGLPNPSKGGAAVMMTATLSTPSGSAYPTPTGAVTFSEGTTTYQTVAAKAGVATYALSGLSAGTHTITATYAGDPYYTSRAVSTDITVYPPATISVVASPNPVYTGHATTVTATLATGSSSSPTPTGTVAFTIDGVVTTEPVTGGIATLPAAVYSNGAHLVTAVYSGDSAYDSVTGTTTIYVQVASATTLTETSTDVFLQNPAIFTAAISGSGGVTPSGTIVFTEGSNVLATVSLTNGAAAFSTSSLTFGQHTITATYSGDNYYVGSVSNNVVENVMDYTLTLSKASTVIAHGGTATLTFVLTPLGGTAMPSEIKYSLSGMRAESTVSFSPTSVVAGSATSTVTVTVVTPDHPTLPPGYTGLLRTSSGLVLALLVLPFSRRMRRHGRKLVLMLLLTAVLCAGLTGCGSGWPGLGYKLALTTNSGPLEHDGTLYIQETAK